MHIELPGRLEVSAVIEPTVQISELLQFTLDHLAAQQNFKPDYWQLLAEFKTAGSLTAANRRGLPTMQDLTALGADAFAEGFSIEGKTSGLTIQNLASIDDDRFEVTYGQESGWRFFDINFTFTKKGADAYFDALRQQLDLIGACLERLPVVRAHIRRDSNSVLGPFPPHALPDMLLYTPSTDEIARDYQDADAYWAAWDRVEYLRGGRALVTRGLEIADEVEFKRLSLKSSFAMARAARPGLTEYIDPDPSDREAQLLANSEKYLTQLGYDPETRSLEFTAVVPENEHLTPADIFLVVNYLENGLADGSPIDEIKVTFVDRAMAEREARPLHDLGVTVQYYGEDGEWRILAA